MNYEETAAHFVGGGTNLQTTHAGNTLTFTRRFGWFTACWITDYEEDTVALFTIEIPNGADEKWYAHQLCRAACMASNYRLIDSLVLNRVSIVTLLLVSDNCFIPDLNIEVAYEARNNRVTVVIPGIVSEQVQITRTNPNRHDIWNAIKSAYSLILIRLKSHINYATR